MIKLDKNKPKTIKMDVNVQGIDKTKLIFNFKIRLPEFSISFKPELVSDNKLEINLPALSSKLVEVNPGRYKACLEIHDGEKYFLKPWEGELIIEEEPIITAGIEESEQLDNTNVQVGFVEDEDYKPKANIENVRENKTKKKPKKKMTKEHAKKFVKEAKKKFINEDEEIVHKFIKKTLNEHGFDYNPKKKNTKNKTKNVNKKNIKTRNDVLNYLKESGIRSENTLNSLMEMLDNKTGGDIDSMVDMADRMVNPQQHSQFENTNDIYQYFQNQQSMTPPNNMSNNNEYGQGQEFDNIDTEDGLSVPSFNNSSPGGNDYDSQPIQSFNSQPQSSGSNSNLMEQIQNAKNDLQNKLNNY